MWDESRGIDCLFRPQGRTFPRPKSSCQRMESPPRLQHTGDNTDTKCLVPHLPLFFRNQEILPLCTRAFTLKGGWRAGVPMTPHTPPNCPAQTLANKGGRGCERSIEEDDPVAFSAFFTPLLLFTTPPQHPRIRKHCLNHTSETNNKAELYWWIFLQLWK